MIASGAAVPETIEQAPAKRGRVIGGRTKGTNPELYKHAPSYKAAQAVSLPADTPALIPQCETRSHSPALERLLKNQSVGLIEVSDGAPEAAKYLVAVATGRKRGEQWRMRAAESILDRTGVTGSTVERAQIAAQAAAGAGADIAPLLERIGQALALRQRAATAIDAVPQTPETGQKSGTPGA